MKLWLDIESRSTVPIRQGNVKYSTAVEIIMLQWAVDGGSVNVEDLTVAGPSLRFRTAAHSASEIWAHQAEFDRTMLETTDWWQALKVPESKWRCTAALARMHGLPGSLDKLCQIFKVPLAEAKTDGKSYIQLFCVPKRGTTTFNDRHSHPKEWAEFLSYGGQDVVAMRSIHAKIPKWNATPRMWAVWRLDYRMNHRGVEMDITLAQAIVSATTIAKKQMAARTSQLSKLNAQGLEETTSAVESTTQVKRLLAYMQGMGVSLPDLTADTVERRLEDESLPNHIKELLRIRQRASKASTAKCQRVLNQHVRGRLFNLLVFCGALRTGRWAGRTIQPQNLPRPKHSPAQISQAIRWFNMGHIDLLSDDDVMGLAASCLRGLIIPAKGRKLVVSDLANIEGRFMAWIAGEDWKGEAYAAYDRKEGPDLYKVAYARAFNIDAEDIADEGDQRRQIGKVMELALQYYGGGGAFCSMAETYGLRLDALATAAWPVIPAEVKRESQQAWGRAQKRRRTYGLSEKVWIVCQSLVALWRAAHPQIVAFWEGLDNAIKDAIRTPNKVFKVGQHIQVDRKAAWLRIRLPSGRYLNYPMPRNDTDGHFSSRSFVGVNPYTRQWGRIPTYSGKDAENVAQGGCADILMDGLLAADEAGYNPVLSVHDEAVTEPPDDPRYDDVSLSQLLVESSLWAKGMPMAAKGKTSMRYNSK